MLRVLLVCTGNICRSPIAHGLLLDRSTRSLGGAIHVSSAGTWGHPGYPATPEAVEAATELGVDIASHRSSSFTADLADWADLVITMTSEQAEEVAEEAPGTEAKTFTLKEMVAILRSLPPVTVEPTRDALLERVARADRTRRAGDAPAPLDLDVADPLGLSRPTYRAVANELEGLVDDLVWGLVGERDTAMAREGR